MLSATHQFPNGYKPELDVTVELGPELASRYLQLIGIGRWAMEIGQLDIYLEISLLSQYQVSPRIGHLEALYHIFAYLKRHQDIGQIVYDPKMPEIDKLAFNQDVDWSDFYGDVHEETCRNSMEMQ
jgi:hypothetical protein